LDFEKIRQIIQQNVQLADTKQEVEKPKQEVEKPIEEDEESIKLPEPLADMKIFWDKMKDEDPNIRKDLSINSPENMASAEIHLQNKIIQFTESFAAIKLYLEEMQRLGKLAKDISLSDLEINSALQKKIISQAHQTGFILLMQQLFHYVELISYPKLNSEKLALSLLEFPLMGSKIAQDLACITGTSERLQTAMLRLENLPYFEKKIMQAHKVFSGTFLPQIFPLLYLGSHIHAQSAVDHIVNINDPDKKFAFPTAQAIPATLAWKMFRDYFFVLDESLRNNAEDIAALNQLISSKRESLTEEEFLKWTINDLEKESGIPSSLLKAGSNPVMETDFDDGKMFVISRPENLSPLAVDVRSYLALPANPFDDDAPQQIAAMIINPDEKQRKIALDALVLIGNNKWLGSSSAQFLKTIYQVFLLTPSFDHNSFQNSGETIVGAINMELEKQLAAINDEIEKLEEALEHATANAAENHAEIELKLLQKTGLKSSLKKITDLISAQYFASPEQPGHISAYINSLHKIPKVELPLLTLLQNNAPFNEIKQAIASRNSAELQENFTEFKAALFHFEQRKLELDKPGSPLVIIHKSAISGNSQFYFTSSKIPPAKRTFFN
jgi:hypothetical protein